ncbi:hypothetical protein NM688_g3034 [Phlebia brevispora]|uniref:Uncharacterized protein n=1 Tax=Phlebia brevispora TaxID=194682 RepID=A0ACC1T6T9_9APHY|nr:hypothetical protein NM688_g3034 [Phlebia brevispora]
MVSFQCEGCGDIVKKPKLDKHGSMCHSAFTCIDCSKTFSGPAEWKSHTSCVSEAEKYQKCLYKGPKGQQQNGGPRYNADGRTNGGRNAPATGKYQSWGRNNGPQGARPAWGRPYTRNEATGANNTPLGTPARMSPVTISPASPAEPAQDAPPKTKVAPKEKNWSRRRPQSAVNGEASEEPRKKKAKTAEDVAAKPSERVEESEKKQKKSKKDKQHQEGGGSAELNAAEESKKKRKDKKSKKTESETEEAVSTESTTTQASAVAEQSVGAEKAGKKEKKEKKERKEKKHRKSKSETEEAS